MEGMERIAVDALPAELSRRGGLCVMIGAASEHLQFAEDLLEAGPWIVHYLESDASSVRKARSALLEKELYGRICVEHWEKTHLPHTDNLANFIILTNDGPSVGRDELMRVLAPEGTALIEDGNSIERVRAPRPDDMGEWTHPWHDADGSLSASDRAFDVPNAFQWVAGPSFPMAGRKTSAGVLLSAGGRTFQITQNVVENLPGGGPNYLVARDAFSGTVLWSRKWEGPGTGRQQRGAFEGIVTCGQRIYGVHDGDVSVFDASTGDRLSIWSVEGTPEKLLLADGILVAQSPKGLSAFDVGEGALMWFRELDQPWGALAADGRIYSLSSSREADGQWHHELAAVDLKNGDLAWTRPTESQGGHPQGEGVRLYFAGEGIVCLIERNDLRFLCAEDGSKLWRYETSATARGGHDSRMAGHFLIDGKVWIRDPSSRSYLAFDPRSGEMLREAIRGGPPVSNRSCQPVLATPRLVFESSKGGTRMWNFATGEAEKAEFVRGGCRIGAAIANGMAYIPPHACGCVGEWYYGNLAILRSGDPGIDTTQPGLLERGAAYGEVNSAADAEHPGAWPMYRRDGQRSGYLPQNISTELRKNWQKAVGSAAGEGDEEWRLNFGRRLSPPVAAGGMLLLAEPQRHQVIALDADSGEENWRFTAAGRVTSPPTIHGQLVLFGAHDGYVYALRRSDGELVWRRRAAPSDRRIMAYGQVESAWPVRNVLVHNGVAIAAAGRAADADGGAVVHGFQPESGEVSWSNRIEPYQARHGKPDLLVADGEDVYLMNKRIDTETGEISEVEFRTAGSGRKREWSEATQPMVIYPEGVSYLRSGQAGFFETSWTRLDMGLRKHQSSWTSGESGGEIIAFSPDVGYAFQLDVGDNLWRVERDPVKAGGKIEARTRDGETPLWLHGISSPAQMEAMLVAENALLVAGPNDRDNPKDHGGFLRIINREDGSEITEIDLPAAPVHDGMAAAEGRVFVVLEDGSVICLVEK